MFWRVGGGVFAGVLFLLPTLLTYPVEGITDTVSEVLHPLVRSVIVVAIYCVTVGAYGALEVVELALRWIPAAVPLATLAPLEVWCLVVADVA